uniref:Uncharacterized protein LOC102806311 n=1 Tax=Saccoglossus kowalevskii TaxID=10224 RepID=A0ABM0MY70_SACKO|nr:PREDICTED: uncharacterized protein LOC102806311 [Saccoglossus kowalevskii]
MRVMCGVKLMDRKLTENLMQMLGLNEAVDRLAKTNGVRWYGHVLRREDGHVLRRALDLEVSGPRKRGRPKKTWKMQVEEESGKVGMRMRDVLNRAKWREGIKDSDIFICQEKLDGEGDPREYPMFGLIDKVL